ncbi:hypothetical protein ACFSQ0_07280 [Mesonia sediminis]|uniref:Uncharacterized protein n=1 Tax=Mesonia sediminis TaxID=1703946 RepID=A0ABW5SGS0_9FLAO
MKKILTTFLLLILILPIYSQDKSQKRILDYDLNSDLDELKKAGYGEKELRVLGVILTERINENKNIDTLTVENCLPLILKHKLYNSDFIKSVDKQNYSNKRDKLIQFNDLTILENINKVDYGIIVFCNTGSINCDSFLTDLNCDIGIQFLEKNKLYYYDLFKKEQFDYLVKRQKELLDSNAQPHFAVVKNGKIINDFIGYRKLYELLDKLNN